MLITLSKSPTSWSYSSILDVAKGAVEKREKVAILHIQDACIAATMDELCNRLAKNKIDLCALKADCDARGLTGKVNARVKLIDFKQWVKLVMVEHDKIVSWTS